MDDREHRYSQMGHTCNIIRRTRFSCWIPKTKNIQSEYVILTSIPWQQWSFQCASLLRYMHNVALLVYLRIFISNKPGIPLLLSDHIVVKGLC